MTDFDRNHSHFIDGRLTYCNRLSHCPSICNDPVDECTASLQPRTKEQGHTAPCLAAAMISALENARDLTLEQTRGDVLGTVDLFRLLVQDNIALEWADEYLSSGTSDCHCPIGPTEGDAEVQFPPRALDEEDVAAAQYAPVDLLDDPWSQR